MSLFVYRSQRVEVLGEQLGTVLRKLLPEDPFVALPIVVGSRGMERWLRKQLAAQLTAASGLAFVNPGAVFDGAAAEVLHAAAEAGDPVVIQQLDGKALPRRAAGGPFWVRAKTEQRQPWQAAAMGAAFIPLVRALMQARPEAFGKVRGYLKALPISMEDAPLNFAPIQDEPPPVSAREMYFSRAVADALTRLMLVCPQEAADWQRDPHTAPEEHRWLAWLLHSYQDQVEEASPAQIFMALQNQAKAEWDRNSRRAVAPSSKTPIFIFGLSSLGAGDMERIRSLSSFYDLHFFALTPSSAWWQDYRTRWQKNRELHEALRAGRVEETIEIEMEYQQQNPLLTSLGFSSKQQQAHLEEIVYADFEWPQAQLTAGRAQREPSFLSRVQAWIDEAGAPRDAQSPGWLTGTQFDTSVQFINSHSPLRQCEVLREVLLQRFEADEQLEPQDVLIMTPDIETFAPLLRAVFSRKRKGDSPEPYLPLYVADQGFRAQSPTAQLVLKLLALAGERVRASALLELLRMPPICTHFGLDEAALGVFNEFVEKSRLRWAWDEQDRSRNEQPELHENTIEFALRRLAMGALVPEPKALQTVGEVVPVPLLTTERVRLFGKFAQILRTIQVVLERFKTPARLDEWRTRIAEALQLLSPARSAQQRVLKRIEAALAHEGDADGARSDTDGTQSDTDGARSDTDGTQSDTDGARSDTGQTQTLLYQRDAITRWLTLEFEDPGYGDRPITGAITLSALEPMRSVPFKVIALLGMDDSLYPRKGQRPSWDPLNPQVRQRIQRMQPRTEADLQKPRCPGALETGQMDRHLVLEALLSARDALIFVWQGHEKRRGNVLPASVVVEELIEQLGVQAGLSRSQWVYDAPLQPWSEAHFTQMLAAEQGDESVDAARAVGLKPTLLSYDGLMAEAALRRREAQRRRGAPRTEVERERGLETGLEGTPPRRPLAGLEAPRHVSAKSFAKAFVDPAMHLLKTMLGLYLDREYEATVDRESLALSHLDQWTFRSRTLQARLEDPLRGPLEEETQSAQEVHKDNMKERLRAEGLLAFSLSREMNSEDARVLIKALLAQRDRWSRERSTWPEKSVSFKQMSFALPKLTLVPNGDSELWGEIISVSSFSDEKCFEDWLTVLIRRCTDPELPPELVGVRWIGRDRLSAKEICVRFPDKIEDCLSYLSDLIELWPRICTEKTHLFQGFSPWFIQRVEKKSGKKDLLGFVRSEEIAIRIEWEEAIHSEYNPWHRELWGEDALASFSSEDWEAILDLAERVWLPYLKKKVEDKKKASEGQAKKGAGQ